MDARNPVMPGQVARPQCVGDMAKSRFDLFCVRAARNATADVTP